MPIFIDEKELVFHLKTPNTSYIMKVWRGKYLAHIYWGKKIDDFSMENALLSRTSGWSPMTDKEDYTLDFICQEYPTGCGTDYRIPAISAVYDDGSRTVELVYEGYKLSKGKSKLKGLPATYVESVEEAETLEITLRDKVKNLKVVLMYTVFNDYDAITRSVRVVNESDKDILLEKVLSGSVDF